MKLSLAQLRKIIKEETQKVVRETRDFVGENELRDMFEELYVESGVVMLEDLESALGVPPGSITGSQLYRVGLKLERDGTVTEL
jgi:hypothetical protein